MGALTNSFSLVLSLFPMKPFCFHKMASEIGDRVSVVGPLEQLGDQRLAELVGPQQK
ncbi:hypothetical protein ATG66_3167 [Vibrio sp. ES.051]|nr:hypothetical protein ATG66_3167 [Vibrio sp. ES.051]